MKQNAQEENDSPETKYRRVVVTRHGGPEVLQVVEEDLPEPGAGEARVKVLAAGVSAYDLMHRRSGSLNSTSIVVRGQISFHHHTGVLLPEEGDEGGQ